MGLAPSTYEGPTGIVGVLADALERSGVEVLSSWAAVPHYVSHPPCPKGDPGPAVPAGAGARTLRWSWASCPSWPGPGSAGSTSSPPRTPRSPSTSPPWSSSRTPTDLPEASGEVDRRRVRALPAPPPGSLSAERVRLGQAARAGAPAQCITSPVEEFRAPSARPAPAPTAPPTPIPGRHGRQPAATSGSLILAGLVIIGVGLRSTASIVAPGLPGPHPGDHGRPAAQRSCVKRRWPSWLASVVSLLAIYALLMLILGSVV